jgi:pimeloyl-ACP methyl ester carboxylesterase
MKLELLENNPFKILNKKPLLFIHGMFHGAWCFEEYYLPYLEKKGYKAFAMSLSNHGNSGRRKNFNLLTIKQYVKDIEEVIDRIGSEPILAGHSMGGFVVQKYLEKNAHKKAILMASVPPYGIWGVTFRVLKNYPLTYLKTNVTLNLKHLVNDKYIFKKLIFTDDTSYEEIEKYHNKLDSESFSAYFGMLGFNLVKPKKINTKFLVIGGEKDQSLVLKDLKKTAKIYHTNPVILEGVGHNLMLDKQWQKGLDKIIEFAY